MATQTVEYVTCSDICCGALPSPVILCVPKELVAPHSCPVSGTETTQYSFIEAEIQFVAPFSCGCNPSFKYTLTYDSTQLIEGAVVSGQDITGIFCKGCFTSWVEEKVGNEPYIRTNEDTSQTFVSPHGCTYPIITGGTPFVGAVSDTDTVHLDVTAGTLSGDVKFSAAFQNATYDYGDGVFTPATGCSLAVTGGESELLLALDYFPSGGILLCGNITLTADLSIDLHFEMAPGSFIHLNGHNLTFNDIFVAGPYKVFSESDSGNITFSKASTDYIVAEWFGMFDSTSHDNTTSFTKLLSVANANNIPIKLTGHSNYNFGGNSIPISIPANISIVGEGIRGIGGPTITYNGGQVNTALWRVSGNNFSLQGVQFNINHNGIRPIEDDITHAHNVTVKNCLFNNLTGNTGVYFNSFNVTIEDTDFVGNSVSQLLLLQGDNNRVLNCNFSGTYDRAIDLAGSSGGNTNSSVLYSTFTGTVHTYSINIQDFKNVLISGNYFNSSPTIGPSIISIDDGISPGSSDITILENTFVGTTTYGIYVNGAYAYIENNNIPVGTSASVKLDTGSTNSYVGWNDFGAIAAANQVVDSGTGNFRLRRTDKGITASRPYRGPTEYGALYLDTTLAAAGEPIWWNGTIWVKYDGSAA